MGDGHKKLWAGPRRCRSEKGRGNRAGRRTVELELLRYIQSTASPALDALFIAMSMLAEPVVIVAALAWIYWNVSKNAGRFISYAALTSMTLNNGIKELFRLPRPIGQEGIRTLYANTATGYSFPSGHSQLMATASSSFCLWFRKNWYWYLSILLMFLVAFSRMYLGVHYPKDVFVGLLLGVGVSWLCSRLYTGLLSHLALYLVTFLGMGVFLLVSRSHDFAMAFGLYGGFVAGCAWEEQKVRFAIREGTLYKLARFAVGLAALGAVYLAGKLLPQGLIFVAARYFLVALCGYGFCPMLFKKLGI